MNHPERVRTKPTVAAHQPVRVLPHVEKFGPAAGFRPDTELNPGIIYFILNSAGVGDYINYMAAILWNAQNIPYLHGVLYAPDYLVEFCRHVLAPYPSWEVRDGSRIELPEDICFIGPELNFSGNIINHQLLNATGAHLIDIGFAYYSNMSPAPAGACLPHLSLPVRNVYFELRSRDATEMTWVPHKYVVFTPGAVTIARTTKGRHLNPLIKWVKERGYLPVFLGKSEVSTEVNPAFDSDILWSEGLDLRNKTTIMQAAAIMQHAACVVGLDNGLLHLASCTPANVVFGYNITSVEHRQPRRKAGITKDVFITKEELSCIACQSKMKLLVNHTFHNCLYRDTRCIDMLFEDEGRRFKEAMLEFLP